MSDSDDVVETQKETHAQKQKRLQPYNYMSFGIPVEHLTKSPIGWNLKNAYLFEQENKIDPIFIEFFNIKNSDKYVTLQFGDPPTSAPPAQSPYSAIPPSQLSSICSLCSFIRLDGMGGIPSNEFAVKATAIIHAQRTGEYDESIRDKHEERIMEQMNENDVAVYLNSQKFNLMIFDVNSKRKKKAILKSSTVFTDWIILLKRKTSYEIIARKDADPERYLLSFRENDIVKLLAATDGDTAQKVEGLSYLGNINPALEIKDEFAQGEFASDDEEDQPKPSKKSRRK